MHVAIFRTAFGPQLRGVGAEALHKGGESLDLFLY